MSKQPAITLYDVASTLEEKTSSFNVWKTKLLLSYKGIPYKTEWVEYDDVERVSKSVGTSPTRLKANGQPHYTIPFITVAFPDNGQVLAISDSFNIATYIEKMFPRKPLFAEGTKAFHAVFTQYLVDKLFWPLLPVMAEPFVRTLIEPDWYVSTREAVIGMSLDKVVPKDEEAVAAAWKQAETALDALAKILDSNAYADDPDVAVKRARVNGVGPSYAEIELVAMLYFVKRVDPEQGWKRIKNRNEGRWSQLLDFYAEYLPVH